MAVTSLLGAEDGSVPFDFPRVGQRHLRDLTTEDIIKGIDGDSLGGQVAITEVGADIRGREPI
jgi:hypothetical protein